MSEENEQQAPPPQPKIEFVIPDEDDTLFTTYANNVTLGWTNFDIRLLFGEVVDVTPERITVEQRAHITISFLQAKLLVMMLAQAVAMHESYFGELKLPPDVSFSSQHANARFDPERSVRPKP